MAGQVQTKHGQCHGLQRQGDPQQMGTALLQVDARDHQGARDRRGQDQGQQCFVVNLGQPAWGVGLRVTVLTRHG